MEEKFMVGGEDVSRSQGLMIKMRELYNRGILTIWEFQEFKKMCIKYAEDENFQFDYNAEEFWQTEKQYFKFNV